MIDRELFSQIGLDSGALTLLGVVTHPLERAGAYRLSVQQQSREVADATIHVDDDAEAMQITVDLSKVETEGCGHDNRMRPGGNVLFHVGESAEKYAAVLAELGAGEPEVVFDSRELHPGDRFVATVLRPGRYAVTNLVSGAKGRLEVSYPEASQRGYQPPDPVEVSVTPRTFRPASLQTKPAQAVVYLANAVARITIELEEPFDRPEPGY